KQQFRELWEIVLRNHFHDILPGSSIAEVYEDSRREYAELFAALNAIKTNAKAALCRAFAARSSLDASTHLLCNYNVSHRPEYIEAEIPGTDAFGLGQLVGLSDGIEFEAESQLTYDRKWLSRSRRLSSKGFAFCRFDSTAAATTPLLAAEDFDLQQAFENEYLRICFDGSGRIRSLYDKSNKRELIQAGKLAKRIVSHQTRPHAYDCWDLNSYYKEKFWEVDHLRSARLVESGPLRSVLEFVYEYQSSTIKEYLLLYHQEARLDLRYEVDWHEHQEMLKLYFPVDIHSNLPTYEIQFGHLQRPSHYNTSWDQARFEVVCHKWLDISEPAYGLSIINDSKFGVGIHESEIGLTMLKAGIYPNPNADIGMHRFAYSLRPHAGDWREAGIVEAAYAFNNPLELNACHALLESECVAPTTGSSQAFAACPSQFESAKTSSENLVVETLKAEEDGEGEILRVYEAFGQRSRVELELGLHYSAVEEVDLIERRLESETDMRFNGTCLEFEIKPFEIRSFRLIR
ncbi:MAG: glycoside hydrolase family 38 C-terminal domain-containing protein, partial [Eubacteriales bacterium]|nr:glycoside hydrolase family 38 C-terminal domain-containing protein [Eubacteriales bacterium]